MADVLTITPQPVRVTTPQTNLLQPIYLAVDAGAYDFLDLETGVVSVEGAVTTFTLDLMTGMQTQTDDGWVAVAPSLSTATTANTWTKVNIPASTGILRYLRWRVTTLTAGTALTFFIRGMARAYK